MTDQPPQNPEDRLKSPGPAGHGHRAGPPPARAKQGKAKKDGIDIGMLEMLVCPLTRTALRYDPEKDELVSTAARIAFPIHDGVPVMLASEARQLDDDEIARG